MMAQIKMGVKLIGYAYKMEMNLFFGVAILLLGTVIDLLSHGTTFLGVFLISVLPMFAVQFLYNICASNAVGASPWRKRMQTTMPALLMFAMNVIVFIVIIIVKLAESWMFPDDAPGIWASLLYAAVLQVLIGAYNGVCYKYFVLSFVLMYITVFGVSFLGGFSLAIGNGSVLGKLDGFITNLCSPVPAILVTFVCIVAGAALQYAVSLAVYKKPLSKWAQGAAMRKYM